jgi:hypothetical protein
LTKAERIGPSPLPVRPWQLAQLSRKSARPKAMEVCAHDAEAVNNKLTEKANKESVFFMKSARQSQCLHPTEAMRPFP